MKKCLKNEKIEKFVKNRLTRLEMREIKKHITECKKCYNKYIEYKELIYFKTKPVKIQKSLLKKITNFYNESIDEEKAVKRFSIIIKATKQALEVLTDSNFELKSDFISASLILKGNERKKLKGDIITITKTIEQYSIELKIEKSKREKFNLSVFAYKNKKIVKKLRVFLISNHQEIESIILSEDNQFKLNLTPTDYILKFEKDKNVLFEIELKIKSD